MAAEVTPELEAEYHNNAGLAVTPECWVTRVPLLIHPNSPSQAGYLRPDDNHHPEHPRLHSQLADEAGLAVRHSRVIRMNHWVHHNAVHSTFRGPELPIDRDDKFVRVLFNAAGYIPGHAIYLHGLGEYSVRPLSESIREKLWKNKAVHVERSGIVTNFLKTYLFDWSLANTSKKDINTLLIARDPVDRWKQARRILSKAAVETTCGIAETFEDMYDRHLLPPKSQGGTPRISGFLMGQLGNRDSEKASISKELQLLFAQQEAGRIVTAKVRAA